MVQTEKAESIVSRSSKKKKNRKKRARQWSCYVDSLKNTIDCMYEMCRSEQSVAGCREAILYLERANSDFKSLIETINVEKEWTDQEPQNRPSVAWEIRKSMSSPNPITIGDKPLLPLSSMIAEAVRNASNAEPLNKPAMLNNLNIEEKNNDCQSLAPPATGMGALTYARITAAAAVAAVAVAVEQKQNNGTDEGWQVVGEKRRKSCSSTTVSEIDREMSVEKEVAQSPSAPLNVYERLSSSSYRRGSAYSNRASTSSSTDNNRLTCPRSAMDLPQTKASMAKMAYSRQLLWEKNQQMLVEKLRARQKREKAQRAPSSTSSASTCGFTFADPLAVRQSVEAFNEQHKQRKNANKSKNESRANSIVSDANRSLHSINEHGEIDGNAEILQIEDSVNLMNSEDIPCDPTPSEAVVLNISDSSKASPEVVETDSNSSSEKVDSQNVHPEYVVVDGLENDVEWRTMTEEEESLALEENSLKLEIKHAESMSIDAELERQVEVEADELEKEHKLEKKLKKQAAQKSDETAALEYENFYKVFQEIQSLATVAWSELMQNTPISSNVHEPGTPVERHEKMNSPSRRKCQKDDDDFGKRHEMKQKRADELRQQLQDLKAAKLKELTNRVEEVRSRQAALKDKKKKLLEDRMRRAAENRDKNIMEVVRRAKDDDQRVMEVKFIASLQEDNKRYDLMMKDANTEEKQKQMADERARRMEEKSAKKREQEAAAVSRRQMAAQARQSKIKQLSEKKEARVTQRNAQDEVLKKSKAAGIKVEEEKIENDSQNSEHMTFIEACTEISEEKVERHDHAWTWPSMEKKKKTVCSICNVEAYSEIGEAAHIFSKQHQNTTRSAIGASSNLLNELRKHIGMIFKDSVDCDELKTEEIFKNGEKDEQMLEAKGYLEKLYESDLTIPLPLSSPRNRTKFVRDFMMALEKMISSKTIVDEQTQMSVEKSLTELLKANEDDTKNNKHVNVEQFCAVGLVPKMCTAIIEWTCKGASLRLCIRLTHAFCIFMKDPRVSYSVLFTAEFLKFFDRIIYLFQSDPTSPQLSGLLDVLNSCLKTAASRIQEPVSTRNWKDLNSFDEKVPNILEKIAIYMRNIIEESEIISALELNRGPALLSRLMTFIENLAGGGKEEGRALYKSYIGLVINHGYTLRRNSEKMSDCPVNMKKTSRDVANAVVGICQNISKNNSEFCKELLLDPIRCIQLASLLEDTIFSCAEISKFQSVDRDWDVVSKDELFLLNFIVFLGTIVEHADLFEKRLLLVGWSGIKNGCFEVLIKLPIRYYMLDEYSTIICPVVKYFLNDSFNDVEKNELLGEFSEELLNL